jgi:hypothetical protein
MLLGTFFKSKMMQIHPHKKKYSHAICHFNEGEMSSWNTTPSINIIDWYQDSQITIIATIEGHKDIDSGHCLHGICVLSYVKSPVRLRSGKFHLVSLPRV